MSKRSRIPTTPETTIAVDDPAGPEQEPEEPESAPETPAEDPPAAPPSLLPAVDEPPLTVAVPEPPVPIEVPPVGPWLMPFLGVLCPPGMVRPSAGLPVVIRRVGSDVNLGVLVVSDPGYLGEVLDLHLEAAGYIGPFVQVVSGRMDHATRYAAARAIVFYKDQDWNLIDRPAAVAALGFGMRAF